MKQRTAFVWTLAAVLIAAAAVTGGRAALSAESDTDLAKIKKDINTLLLNQQTILTELKNVREDLNVVKIRCSS